MRKLVLLDFLILCLALDPIFGHGEELAADHNSVAVQTNYNNNATNSSDKVTDSVNKLGGAGTGSGNGIGTSQEFANRHESEPLNVINHHSRLGIGHYPRKMKVLNQQRYNYWTFPKRKWKQRLPTVNPSTKPLDNETFVMGVLRRYKIGILNIRRPGETESKAAGNQHIQDASAPTYKNPQTESASFKNSSSSEKGQDKRYNNRNATLSSVFQQGANRRDRKKMVYPFKQSYIEQSVKRLTVKDYEIAMWFGVALGAFLVLVIGGSIILVRKLMPRRFKSVFERIPYGQVKDLALPADTSCEDSPMWSPVNIASAHQEAFVTIRSTNFRDDRHK